MASDAPPSYESIVAKLNTLVGDTPTPQKVMDAAATLPRTEIDILAANNDKHPPLTSDQHEAFSVGLAQTASSPEAAVHLQTAADQATAGYMAIEAMFTDLSAKLSDLDSKYPLPPDGAFAPKLADFHTGFRTTVSTSKDLAVKIAVYGHRFDEVMIPLAQDPAYTIEKRKKKLAEFIGDAEAFSKEATAMQEDFSKLKDKFGIFVGTFGTWAKQQENADTTKLNKAKNDLDDLNDRLGKIELALYSLGAITALSLPITGIAAALSGPFGPFVMIGGLIFAGAALATTVGLYFAAQDLQKDIQWKQDEITNLQNEIDNIKATRTGMENLGKADLVDFSRNIDTLGQFWKITYDDAVRVKQWLEGGAKDADMPEYMKISTDKAVKLYATMADYLDKYADGIQIVTP